jgi:beta-mannosidase
MTTPIPSATISSHQRVELHSGWQLASTTAGECRDVAQLATQALAWRNAIVPGTVAQSLQLNIDEVGRFDAQDWWYRCRFPASPKKNFSVQRVRFDGLATLAQVWLNGTLILSSRNMFTAHSCVVDELLQDADSLSQSDNELVICFRSLDAELTQRKPRPRWKTALVPQQNMRWVRTTLLGRVPGWTPPIQPVGPWRAIAFETVTRIDIARLSIDTMANGTTGQIEVAAEINMLSTKLATATLCVGDRRAALALTQTDSHTVIAQRITFDNIPLWWPHTHGRSNLLPCHIELNCVDEESGSEIIRIDCGTVGFKHMALDRSAAKVQLIVNGVPVFCRGACWTINDFRTLNGTAEQLRETLRLARDANINMLRIGGTMVYESDLFYRLCDEFGIMVWQDFMFANMDYPVSDAEFRSEIENEIKQQLFRLQRHVCVSVYCGGSEIEQQASMLGLPRSEWSNEFFSTALPELCERLHPGIPYFPSTPCEGVLPIHVDVGLAHYYGVGAYRRPLNDAKHANVKFTPECLGFSNVPEPETVDLLLDGALPPPHHPLWKMRQPRDTGPGWDFEDIRDFYLKLLFGVDPVALRSQDVERYYALSRVVTGEVMKNVFAEWRRTGSSCGGGLIWFYKDLWPGAGWGIIDSENRSKAVYHYLRRAWAPHAILITDEGLNGLQLHAINETADACTVRVEIELLQAGKIRIAHAERNLELSPRTTLALHADELIGHFTDITYSYRFGPPKHDVVVARMICAQTAAVLSEDFYFPQGLALPLQQAAQIEAAACFDDDGNVIVTLISNCFLQSVQLTANGFAPDDNYFHLTPNQQKQISFTAIAHDARKFKAHLSALNIQESLTLRAERA